jgi:hypothetical protein
VFSSPGSTYEAVVGSRLRSPASLSYAAFPGDTLTVDGSGIFENNALVSTAELRFKHLNPGTNYFKKLVLNGGQLDNADDGVIVIQGQMDIAASSSIYIDLNSTQDRGYQVDAWLTGTGDIFWHQFSGTLSGPSLGIAGTSNTFRGQWIVDQGVLVGMGANSLGTNAIIVGTNGLTAAVETLYNINNPNGSLVLGATGQLFLHQNDTFKSVTINGTPLADGVYTFAQLNGAYPANFPSTWTPQNGSGITTGSGSVTVGAAPPPVTIQAQFSAGTLTLTWSQGALLQATNVLGPWLTNATATSPYTVMPATNGPRMFYRVQVQ